MKTLYILALLFPVSAFAQTAPDTLEYDLDSSLLAPLVRVQSYNCSETTCGQIRSCEEACYKLRVCGHTRRDGDNDGIPCEDLCSRRCP